MNTNCQTITESVYMRKRSQVLSIFLKAGIDMQESEDLTQEVFLRMMGVDVLNHDTADAMVIKIAYNLKIPRWLIYGRPGLLAHGWY